MIVGCLTLLALSQPVTNSVDRLASARLATPAAVTGEPVTSQDPMGGVRAAHAEGRFEAARALATQALEDPGAPRLALLHAVGACEYELGRPDRAVLAWRRALLHAPDDGDLLADLALAEQQLGLDRQAMRAFDPLPQRTWLLLLACGLECAGLGLLVLGRRRVAGGVIAALGLVLGVGLLPRHEEHIVVLEAVGDRDTRPHESNLFDLQAKYAEVKGMNEVIDYLGGL